MNVRISGRPMEGINAVNLHARPPVISSLRSPGRPFDAVSHRSRNVDAKNLAWRYKQYDADRCSGGLRKANSLIDNHCAQ